MYCLIVDDDSTSRKVIEAFVDQTDDLNLSGSFAEPKKALKFLKTPTRVVGVMRAGG